MGAGPGLRQGEGQVAGRNLRETGNGYVSAQDRTLQRAHQAKRFIRGNADPGIAEANFSSAGGQVEADGPAVGDEAAKGHQPAASTRRQVLHFQPVLIEDQASVDIAKSGGQVNHRETAVLDIDAPRDRGLRHRTIHREVQIRDAVRTHLGIKRVHQTQVDVAIGAQSQPAIVLQAGAAGQGEARIPADQGAALYRDHLVRHRQFHGPIAGDRDLFHFHGELVEAELAVQQPGLLQGPGQLRMSSQRRVAGDPLADLRRQKRIDVEAGKLQLQIGRHVATQFNPSIHRQAGRGEIRSRRELQMTSHGSPRRP